MAKGKHSAALFEVIKGNSRGSSQSVTQSLRTPNWWFKTRPATSTPADVMPPRIEAEASAPLPAAPPAPRPPARATGSIPYASRSSAVHLDFDRARKEITLRLRYTTALVSAFGVCAIVCSAYVIGRHLNQGPQTASAAPASSAAPLYARQAPQAGVATATRQQLLHPLANETPQPRRTDTPVAPTRTTAPLSLVPASAETGMPRAIGLNYVIIQTYPGEEADGAAKAACDFLNKNGIPCTLEKTDYARNPNWICLVGTAGFAKISSNDYKTYVDNIIKLGDKFPSSRFDHFRPAAFKWKGT